MDMVHPEDPFEPGRNIGQYHILRELGRGGMGRVYLAKETNLGDREVAIKVILATSPSETAEAHARFFQEVKNLARLDHHNIVTIFTAGYHAGYPYFVMQYVAGRELLRFVDECASLGDQERITRIVQMIVQVARTVHYAHTNGIVHRDLKPANILVTHKADEPMILDFGIARHIGDTRLTSGPGSPGTPAYRAPEQIDVDRGVRDELIDVWAIGVILYRLLTGVAPFKGNNPMAFSASVLYVEPPAPRSVSPQIPAAVEQIILRCLQKDPEHRPTSALAVAELLGQALASTRPGPSQEASEVGDLSAGANLPTERDGVPASIVGSWMPRAPGARPLGLTVLAVGLFGAIAALWYGAPSGPDLPRNTLQRTSEHAADSPSQRARVTAISVMEFTERSGSTKHSWMRDAIRDNLNGQLSKAPDWKVFSKDFIDFKAHGLVADGKFPDLKPATMAVAQQLGVTKAVLGTFHVDDDRLSIEAHVVDLETGLREPPDTVDGARNEFSRLQESLATKIMVRLGVDPAVTTAGLKASSLDSYKLLLQAEGAPRSPDRQSLNRGPLDVAGIRVVASSDLSPVPRPRPELSWRSLLTELTRPGVAMAGDGEEEKNVPASPEPTTGTHEPKAADLGSSASDTTSAPDPEEQIRGLLERYRLAYEKKDVFLLAEVYEEFTPEQVTASTSYFENANQLTVRVDDVEIALREDVAAVSYTRKDEFTDATSGAPVVLEVRLTKVLVRADDTWKIARTQ